MRLLNTQKVQLIEVYGIDTPSYAILSHTWSDGEILLQDLQAPAIHDAPWAALSEHPPDALAGKKSKGLEKLLRIIQLARDKGHKYLWVDTCCIDKTSSAELSEAINSMYNWYAAAEVCYAYLSDVPAAAVERPLESRSKFRRSRWFKRGWTLQELIAPHQVELYASDWTYLGSKTGDLAFTGILNEITGVQLEVLLGDISPQEISIAPRMHWAAERKTTRVEDVAYCLLGIFDVNMPLLYGEGKRSFIRLQEAILTREEDQSLFAWHFESHFYANGDIWQSSGLSGLLADSPDRFWDANDIETAMPLALAGDPFAVTSKGLGVDFFLLPCPSTQDVAEADFRVVLNCERLRNGQRESPVIYLKRIWGVGDQFARVRPDLKTFVPPNTSLLEGGRFERVFVKQDPSIDMRTICVVADKDNSRLQLPGGINEHRLAIKWSITDAWPKQGWVESRQTFQTRDLTLGMPCGILRLEIIEPGLAPRTMDVAVGMHTPSERLCRSWCQIMNFSSFLAPESSFSWAKREAESGNVPYSSLSTQDIHGADVSTWVVVTERNRKGKLDISLHVLSSKPEIRVKPEGHNNREGNGEIIPLSTLPEDERSFSTNLTLDLAFNEAQPPWENGFWKTWRSAVSSLMAEICIVDSIGISVFPHISFGSKVRVGSHRGGPASLGSLKEYCIDALPASDREARELVHVLCEGGDIGARTYHLDASRVLDGRPNPYLELRSVHWAVIGGNAGILELLLKSGIEAIGTSEERLTTLHLAFLQPGVEAICSLWSAIYQTKDSIDEDENSKETIGNNDCPSHFAASYATSLDVWGRLINDIHLTWRRNRLGETPLHRAAAMGNVAAVDYFTLTKMQRGRNYIVSVVDNQGRTPLWHAACSDFTGRISTILLKGGANPDLADDSGLAPIHVACRQGAIGCLKWLRYGGANLNNPAGVLGLLPTHFAAIFGRQNCLHFLLQNQAKVVSGGTEGVRVYALDIAIANGHEACARSIWNSANVKPSYKGWSLCLLRDASTPYLKWMYLEINEQHWFASEEFREPGDTQGMTLLSPADIMPQLWIRAGVPNDAMDEDLETVSDDEVDEVTASLLEDQARTRHSELVVTSLYSDIRSPEIQAKSKLRGFRRKMKSVFNTQ